MSAEPSRTYDSGKTRRARQALARDAMQGRLLAAYRRVADLEAQVAALHAAAAALHAAQPVLGELAGRLALAAPVLWASLQQDAPIRQLDRTRRNAAMHCFSRPAAELARMGQHALNRLQRGVVATCTMPIEDEQAVTGHVNSSATSSTTSSAPSITPSPCVPTPAPVENAIVPYVAPGRVVEKEAEHISQAALDLRRTTSGGDQLGSTPLRPKAIMPDQRWAYTVLQGINFSIHSKFHLCSPAVVPLSAGHNPFAGAPTTQIRTAFFVRGIQPPARHAPAVSGPRWWKVDMDQDEYGADDMRHNGTNICAAPALLALEDQDAPYQQAESSNVTDQDTNEKQQNDSREYPAVMLYPPEQRANQLESLRRGRKHARALRQKARRNPRDPTLRISLAETDMAVKYIEKRLGL